MYHNMKNFRQRVVRTLSIYMSFLKAVLCRSWVGCWHKKRLTYSARAALSSKGFKQVCEEEGVYYRHLLSLDTSHIEQCPVSVQLGPQHSLFLHHCLERLEKQTITPERDSDRGERTSEHRPFCPARSTRLVRSWSTIRTFTTQRWPHGPTYGHWRAQYANKAGLYPGSERRYKSQCAGECLAFPLYASPRRLIHRRKSPIANF